MGEIIGIHQALLILVKIGFIHEKDNCISRTKTCFWMILSLLLGFGTIYEDMEIIIHINQISYLFAILSTDILLPLQTCLTFPCLGYLVLADHDIIKDLELKAPRRKIHLILFVLSSVASYSTLLHFYLFTNSVFFCTSCLLVLCCLAEIISVLLIGTVATNLQLNIKELAASRYYTGITEEYQKIVSRFKNLKKGLGPILLLIFSSRMLTLICITKFAVRYIGNAPLLICILTIGLLMFYITSTLHQLFDIFKSNKKSLW